MPCPFEMRVRARLLPGDPPALAVGLGDAPVERGRELERHERPCERAPGQKPRHRRRRRRSFHPHFHRDPRRPEPRDPTAGGAWVGVLQSDDDARDAARDQQVAARRAARRLVRAGFQRHVASRAARLFARLDQRHRLGVRATAGLRPAAPDDAVVVHDHAADVGIGRRPPPRPLGERQRRPHPAVQIPHLVSWSSSCLNSACRFSCRAFCSASALALIGPSIACCARICASLRSADHCST